MENVSLLCFSQKGIIPQTFKLGEMKTVTKQPTQYFSKWRKDWVDFTDHFGNKRSPNEQEVKHLLMYHYKLR